MNAPEWFWLLVGPGGAAPAFIGLGEWVALAAVVLVPLLAVRGLSMPAPAP